MRTENDGLPLGVRPLVLAVLGPTASGKSALGLALAERYGGEIINCDSTAVYRGFDIGTDKVATLAIPTKPLAAGQILLMSDGTSYDEQRKQCRRARERRNYRYSSVATVAERRDGAAAPA